MNALSVIMDVLNVLALNLINAYLVFRENIYIKMLVYLNALYKVLSKMKFWTYVKVKSKNLKREIVIINIISYFSNIFNIKNKNFIFY
jgi:hypothetical protein